MRRIDQLYQLVNILLLLGLLWIKLISNHSMLTKSSCTLCQVHKQWTQFFFILFSFLFSFQSIFLIFYFQNIGLGLGHKTQRMKQKDLEQMMLYNMDTICWPYVLYIVVQGRVCSSKHGPLVVVYKVDQFVKGSLLSSLMLLNTRVVLLSHSKDFRS